MKTETDKVTLAEIRLSGICPSCKTYPEHDRYSSHHSACIRRKCYVTNHLIMSFNPNKQKVTCQLDARSGPMTYKCSYEDYNLLENAVAKAKAKNNPAHPGLVSVGWGK